MDDNSERPAPPEDRVTKALPYVVGLLVAFGLLIYNSVQQGADDSQDAQGTELASGAAARAEVGPVRRALDRPEFAAIEVGEYDGTIVLTGEVADETTRATAVAAARDASGGSPVDDRLTVAAEASPTTVVVAGADDDPPATAAASTIAPATAPTTAAVTTVVDTATTVVASESTASTLAPETTLAPASAETVAPAPADTTAAGAAATAAPAETAAPIVEPSADTLDLQLAELLKAQPIQFELLASRIAPVSFPTLDQAATIIQSSASARFEVQGHTDSGGQPSFNQRLSEQRAASVRQYLVDRGVAADRLVAVGYGETRPVARNATPEGRSLNRRVEIIVLR